MAWCRNPISNSSMAEEMGLEKISGIHVMWMSGLVPVHAWSHDNFERLVSRWGSVILLEEAITEPSSFERGRVLIETTVIDRIEKRLELSVGGHVFPIRLSESDMLLHGP
ncbi:hypothetical protein V6N12_023870 [Hibiscus sabdariffa]|uniref:DUF4283 domain-containing protein n=1 Tax=Hibiscus sabdariffa TaxID=183260 RepID=A0ABR2FYZ4_9ROSI